MTKIIITLTKEYNCQKNTINKTYDRLIIYLVCAHVVLKWIGYMVPHKLEKFQFTELYKFTSTLCSLQITRD